MRRKAIREAFARHQLFDGYTDNSHAARLQAPTKFVLARRAYWDGQWKVYGAPEGTSASEKAFFDGAVTAWDNWCDDLVIEGFDSGLQS